VNSPTPPTPTPLTYRDSGVDIDAGAEVVERIKPLVKRSFRPEVMGGLGGFGALFDLSGKYREPVLVSGTDGVGTKLKLAQELGRHDTIGIDLVGMCVNDVLVQGAEPLFFLDYFATGKLDVDTTVAVVGGIARGCEMAGCALIGGETAEMPDMYPPGEYDLAGFTVGAVEKSQLLDGSKVRAGDVLIGIASSGPHSNGYSLIRRIYDRAGRPGDVEVGGVKLIDALMAPTTLYVKPILELLRANEGAHKIGAMAHITGGGLTENIIRVIPDGLGLDIEASAIVLPPVFDWLQREGAVPQTEMWRTFNCGVGFVLVVASGDVAMVESDLAHLGLAHRPIGAVVRASGSERVRIG
jgi:phosphoribosylformylglycinamidine cyclo-ligase